MNQSAYPPSARQTSPSVRSRWLWALIITSIFIGFIGLLLALRQDKRISKVTSPVPMRTGAPTDFSKVQRGHAVPHLSSVTPGAHG